jgi:hypothetical protein
MSQKDYVTLKFDFQNGCMHYEDIDQICGVSQETKEIAKKVIKNEINKKINEFRVSPWLFCLIPIGMITFMVGGILATVIFPYNFILVVIGFLTFGSFGFVMAYKNSQISKRYPKLSQIMSKKTKGELRLEPVFNLFYTGRRRGFNSSCTHFLIKTRTSSITANALRLNQNPLQPNLLGLSVATQNSTGLQMASNTQPIVHMNPPPKSHFNQPNQIPRTVPQQPPMQSPYTPDHGFRYPQNQNIPMSQPMHPNFKTPNVHGYPQNPNMTFPPRQPMNAPNNFNMNPQMGHPHVPQRPPLRPIHPQNFGMNANQAGPGNNFTGTHPENLGNHHNNQMGKAMYYAPSPENIEVLGKDKKTGF